MGSEEIEPGVGWAYGGFLRGLAANTAMTGRELGQAIVEANITQNIRILDDEARAALTGGEYTAESVIADMSLGATMAAIDLSVMAELNSAVNDVATSLRDTDQGQVARARAYSQSTGPLGRRSKVSSFARRIRRGNTLIL